MADGQAQIVLSAVDRTKAAFDSAKRNLSGLQASAGGVLGRLNPILGTVGLLGSALSALSFKSLVDGIDALNDLKDATGSSIENLSALEDVADRTGTSMEAVGSSLTKLNRDLTQASPGSQTAETLKAIGLSAEELRRLDPAEALLQVAKAIDGYADSGRKARIIQALFGKSVQEVGPFLKDLAERGELNAKVTTEQAEQAERFNKQLFELQKNIKDSARDIAGPFLTSLNETIAAFKAGTAEGKSFLQIWKELSVAKFTDVLGLPKTSDAERLRQINSLLTDGFQTQEVQLELERERVELQERMQRAQAKAAAELPKAPDAPKPEAPEVPDVEAGRKAAAEALANLRRITDGNVKAITAGLQDAQDELRFGEQASRQLYSLGLQSLEKYFDDQDRARIENLDRVRKATAAEIAERQKLLNSPLLRGADKAADRQEVTNQIAEARDRLRSAERETDQQASLAVRERAAALAELRNQVGALDAQIADLATGGTQQLADQQRIVEQVRAAQQLLRQSGASDADAQARAQRFGELLDAQRQFNVAREQFSIVTANAAREEERLLLAAERNGSGLLETEDAVHAAREKALGQLEQLIASTRELAAANPKNTPLQQYLADLELQAERARAALDPRKLRLDAAASDAAGALTDGLRSAVLEGGKLRDIIADVDKRLTGIFLEEAVFKPFQQELGNILRGAGGKGLGENVFGAILGPSGNGEGLFDRIGGAISRLFGGGGASTAEVARATTGIGGGTLADAASSVLGGGTGAASAASAAALTSLTTAATAATAALSTLASAGGSNAAASAATSAAGSSGGGFWASIASFFGFQKGGYTGDGGATEPAGVVHAGEFVMSAPAVKRIGLGRLEALHSFGRGSAPRMGREPGSYQIGGYVQPLLRRVAQAVPAAQAARAGTRELQRPTAILHYTAAPGDSRQTSLQRARDMTREVQRGFRGG